MKPSNTTKTVVSASPAKKKRRCRFPGCPKTIKSQGHCQQHGAIRKRCKIEGCDKQAQSGYDAMCKRHWREINRPKPPPPPSPPELEGESVYDSIIPACLSWKYSQKGIDNGEVMPLVTFLRDGASKEAGWHRNAERRARGMEPVSTATKIFEPWERQLLLFEIMLITGTMHSSQQDLAHAWGRETSFRGLRKLATDICKRRGKLQREPRSDVGKAYTPERREAFRAKCSKSKMKGKISASKANDGETSEGALTASIGKPENESTGGVVEDSHATISQPDAHYPPDTMELVASVASSISAGYDAAPNQLEPSPIDVALNEDKVGKMSAFL